MIVVVLPVAMDLGQWPPVASRELLSVTISSTSRALKKKMMRRSPRKETVTKVPRMAKLKARTKRKRTRKKKLRAVMPDPMKATRKVTQRIALFQKKSLPLKKKSNSLIVVDLVVPEAQEVVPRSPSHLASSKLRQ